MAAPFLKWAGGKSRLVPLIASAGGLSEASRFVEPFLGGGAVYFGLKARGLKAPALLNDLNAELAETYSVIRDQVESLIGCLDGLGERYTPADEAARALQYYEVRSTQPSTAAERAARLIFLNRTCFNGLYRVNSHGEFNVPHGRYARPRICDPIGLRKCSGALKDASIDSRDFEEICDLAGAGDFVYLDPPYQPLSRTSSFTSYTDRSFGEEEQVRLAAGVRRMAGRGASFVLSNSAHPFVERLYSDFPLQRVLMARAINSVGSGRQAVEEFLISNLEFALEGQPAPDLHFGRATV